MDGRDEAARAVRPSPPARVPQLLPLLTVVVALAVVAGAALTGPWELAPRDAQPVPVTQETATPPPTPEVGEVPPPPEPGEGGVPLTLLLAVAGLLLLALALRALLRRATLARGTDAAPYEPSLGTVGAPAGTEVEPDLPALRRGVTAARAVLASGAAPDDAIIAAWLELEAAAASSGVVRAASDTPTELTTAVLDATSADPDATRRLLRLYHRARFAPHAVITPADLTEAGHCLERLARSWAAP